MTNEELLESLQDTFNSTDNMNVIRDAILSINSGGSGPLVYKAYLTQSGVEAPNEDDLDGSGPGTGAAFIDTLGGAWSYSGVGTYIYTKEGAFTDVTKIFITLGSAGYQGADIYCDYYRIDDDSIELDVFRSSTFVSPALNNKENGVLYKQPITIEVYP